MRDILPLFGDESWEILTTPGSEAYSRLWAPLLVSEVIANLAFIVAFLVLLALFLQRSHRFTRAYVAVVLSNLGFIGVDAWVGSLILPAAPIFDPETAREFSRGSFRASSGCLTCWCPGA